MGVIDEARTLGLDGGVDPENDSHSLAPIGLLGGGIEQTPIGPVMTFVIVGDMGGVGSAILESVYRRRLAPPSAIAPCACWLPEYTP